MCQLHDYAEFVEPDFLSTFHCFVGINFRDRTTPHWNILARISFFWTIENNISRYITKFYSDLKPHAGSCRHIKHSRLLQNSPLTHPEGQYLQGNQRCHPA